MEMEIKLVTKQITGTYFCGVIPSGNQIATEQISETGKKQVSTKTTG